MAPETLMNEVAGPSAVRIPDLLQRLDAADAAVAEADERARIAKELATAAKPATRKQLAATAAALRTQVLEARAAAVERYELLCVDVQVATDEAEDALRAYAEARVTAHRLRQDLIVAHTAVAAGASLDIERLRAERAADPENRDKLHALRAAQAAAEAATADLQPFPRTLAARSVMPFNRIRHNAWAAALRLPV